MLSFGIPFALVPLVLLTRRRDVMGALVNRPLTTAAAAWSRPVVIALNVFLLVQTVRRVACRRVRMALAETFDEIVGSLPDDWTDLELDLRIFDEERYIDAAVFLVVCNAQPYSATTGTGGSSSPIASATPRRPRRSTPR